MHEMRVKVYRSPAEQRADEADAVAHGWQVIGRRLEPRGRLGVLGRLKPARLMVTYQRVGVGPHWPIVRPAARQRIPAGVRFRILQRDGHRCRYCGRGVPEA